MSAYNLVTILQWSWNNLVTFLKLRHSTCENKRKYYIHMYWIWESTKNHSTILQQSSKCLVSGPTYFTNLVKCKIVVKSWNNPETIMQQSCWMQDCLNFRNRRSIHISTQRRLFSLVLQTFWVLFWAVRTAMKVPGKVFKVGGKVIKLEGKVLFPLPWRLFQAPS